MQNAPVEHSAVLFTCIKLPQGFKTFVLSTFKMPHLTGFTVIHTDNGMHTDTNFATAFTIWHDLV